MVKKRIFWTIGEHAHILVYYPIMENLIPVSTTVLIVRGVRYVGRSRIYGVEWGPPLMTHC